MIHPVPVITDPPDVQRQNPGSQALDGDPRQNQIPGIVGNIMKTFVFNRLWPSDKLLSGFDGPGCRTPADAGQRHIPGKRHILEMIAHNLGITKVMKLIHQAIVRGSFSV